MSLVLGARDLTVDFPGTRALENVSVEMRQGEVLAVVGANGSGKTTLLSVLCGLRRPTAGALFDQAGPVAFRSPREALRHGVTLVPQEPQLAGTLACWENMVLGESRPLGLTFSRSERREAAAIVRSVLPEVHPFTPAASLRKGDRALLALAAALRRKPRLLALDEPTAVLGERSVQVVADAIDQVRSENGAVILVSHRMRDIVELADYVVVLVDGRVSFAGEIGGMTADALVTKVAHGRSDMQQPSAYSETGSEGVLGAEVLAVSQLQTRTGIKVESLTIRSGEIVGVAGLGGSGRSRILRALSGAEPPASGAVQIAGQPLNLKRGVRNARAAGVLYVPEDRVAEAVFPPLSVAANVTVSELVGFRRLASKASRRELGALAASLVERFSIRAPHLFAPVTSLSGGNQQRVVLARVLARNPILLIADEPTQGVDAHGRSDIHSMLRTYARSAGAVLVSISDFEELLELSTRILVMRDGALLVDARAEDLDYRELLALTSGAQDVTPTQSAAAPVGAR